MYLNGVFLSAFLLFAKQIEYNFHFFTQKGIQIYSLSSNFVQISSSEDFVSYNSGVTELVISNRPRTETHLHNYSLNFTQSSYYY